MKLTVMGAMKEGKFRPFLKDDLAVLETSGYTLRVKSTLVDNNDFEVELGRPSISASQVGTVRKYKFPNGAEQAHDGRRFSYAELKFDLATNLATLELRAE